MMFVGGGVTSLQLHAALEGDYGNFTLSRVDDSTIRWTEKETQTFWDLKFGKTSQTKNGTYRYSFLYLIVQQDCPFFEDYEIASDYRDSFGNPIAMCELKTEWAVESLRPDEKDWKVYGPKILGNPKPLNLKSLQKPSHVIVIPPKDLVFLQKVQLPATISFDASIPAGSNEDGSGIIAWYTTSKKPWGNSECDALTWFLSDYYDYFSFRFRGYHFQPNNQKATVKQLQKIKTETHQWYKIVCSITATNAKYFVDGMLYATADYPLDTIKSSGHFGFDNGFHSKGINVRNLEITPLVPGLLKNGTID